MKKSWYVLVVDVFSPIAPNYGWSLRPMKFTESIPPNHPSDEDHASFNFTHKSACARTINDAVFRLGKNEYSLFLIIKLHLNSIFIFIFCGGCRLHDHPFLSRKPKYFP